VFLIQKELERDKKGIISKDNALILFRTKSLKSPDIQDFYFCPKLSPVFTTAWAAAKRAIGTRKGEQLT